MRIQRLAAAAALGVAAAAVSGCATGLPTNVTRYSTAIPQGQSFYVVPADGMLRGLEFNNFASLVSQQMIARGYRQAPSTASADMLVKIGYGVDHGTQHISVDPFYGSSPYYGGGFYGRPYWARFGYRGYYRSPFYWGWDDPFWYGSPYGARKRVRCGRAPPDIFLMTASTPVTSFSHDVLSGQPGSSFTSGAPRCTWRIV